MPDGKTLYDEDFLAWSREQAKALRSAAQGASNRALDWDNLAEEIEGLGISQESALESQIRRIIEHLLKLENSRASGPRRGWKGSIVDARNNIEALLARNPSLANEMRQIVAAEQRRGAKKALIALERHRETDIAVAARIRTTTYTEEQILGDWFPPEPKP